MPFSLNILELQVYQPCIAAVQSKNLIPAYNGVDFVDQEVTNLFDTKPADDVVICSDFSRFDQHFNEHMQFAARTVLASIIDAPDWMESIFPVKYRVPLCISENEMYDGPHGMGSGSGGTNFDECLAHKCLQFECALKSNQMLNPHSMAYGDDGILTFPGISLEKLVESYESHGQVCNPDKQHVSKYDAVVLRRYYNMNYRPDGIMRGVYSSFRALGRMMGQERFYDPKVWSREMVELRYLSILENCK